MGMSGREEEKKKGREPHRRVWERSRKVEKKNGQIGAYKGCGLQKL